MILMSDLVCSRGAATAGSIATGGTMALMTVTAGVPLSSIAKGVIKREAVECLSALVRRADQGEPPARQGRLRRDRRASGSPGDRDDVGELG